MSIKWIIGLSVAAVLAFILMLYGQISYAPRSALFKETLTITFGTTRTADTTSVTGAAATDRYFVMPTAQPNGRLWAVASAGQVIVNSTATETTLTCNVVRYQQ